MAILAAIFVMLAVTLVPTLRSTLKQRSQINDLRSELAQRVALLLVGEDDVGRDRASGRDQVRADHCTDSAAPHHEPQRPRPTVNRVEVSGRVTAQVQGGVAEPDEC